MYNVDITKLDEKELKALAYDQIALKEQSQKNLNDINLELSKRQKDNLKNTKPIIEDEKDIKKKE